PAWVRQGSRPGLRAPQRAEVVDCLTVPEEAVGFEGARGAGADDLALTVDGGGAAVTAQRAEVQHGPAVPEKRVPSAVGRPALAHHLALVVDSSAEALTTPEGAQVPHGSGIPEEGAEGATAVQALARDVTSAVDGDDDDRSAAERAQVLHGPIFPAEPARVGGRPGGEPHSRHSTRRVDRGGSHVNGAADGTEVPHGGAAPEERLEGTGRAVAAP